MTPDKLFPLILIVINIGAVVANAWSGNITKTVYWSAAAILNTAVTFDLGKFPWAR